MPSTTTALLVPSSPPAPELLCHRALESPGIHQPILPLHLLLSPKAAGWLLWERAAPVARRCRRPTDPDRYRRPLMQSATRLAKLSLRR